METSKRNRELGDVAFRICELKSKIKGDFCVEPGSDLGGSSMVGVSDNKEYFRHCKR